MLNNNSFILSVAIATKNREEYCIEAIKTILEFNNNIEICIADNSSTTKIKDYVEKLSSPQIKYNYDNGSLSSIDNFNKSINLTTGKYIILIGDDDVVLPEIVDIAFWMDKNNIDSVSSNKVINYIWPNPASPEKSATLNIPFYSLNSKVIDIEKNLNKLLRQGLINYQSYDLPRIYHGIIKKDCMEKIKKETGDYFGGLSPDIYSTIALSCFLKKNYIIDYPFSIAGACPVSTTVLATNGQHSGELKDAPHLINRKTPYLWDNLIPEYYSVETIWAESGLKALRDMNREDLIHQFNKYNMYVYGIALNHKHILKLSIAETHKQAQKLKIHFFIFYFNLFFTSIKIAFKISPRRLKNIFIKKTIKPSNIIKDVKDIHIAYKKVNENLISFQNYPKII